jgi:Expansin C-terminal domain
MQVDCQPPGPIVIDVDVFKVTNGPYLRLDLQSVAGNGALTSVALRPSGTDAWQELQNSYGAKWQISGLSQAPMDIQIIGDNGQTVVAK